MKKVLVIAAVLALMASLPASSAYVVNWFDGFQGLTAGQPLSPQSAQWDVVPGKLDFNVVTAPTLTDGLAAEQGAGGVSQVNADLRDLNANGSVYASGYAKYWMYDPGNVGAVQTDGRCSIYSSLGGDSVSEMFSAQVQANNTTDFWEAQWSWTPVMMDGIAAPTAAGYTFTAGPAAPRLREAWSYVFIFWQFNYATPGDPNSGGSGTIKWYVNQMSVSPNLTLNFDSTSGRWPASHEIVGPAIGALYADSTPCVYDNIEFHANPVPEPSSLLALGTGLVGLMGLIRRKR